MRLAFLALAAALPMTAHADSLLEDHRVTVLPPPTTKDIVITSQGSRSTKTIIELASIAGVAAIMGGFGLYWHLDSRSAANDVSSPMTGNVWTPSEQATYDRANSSATKAEVFYGIGGAALIGAIVGLIMTEPKTETTVIHPHVTPTVAPAPGGAVLGGTWSF